MQKINGLVKKRALELLNAGEVQSVLGWTAGEFFYDHTPAFFETAEELDGLVYDSFCGANLSKYLIAAGKKTEGKILVLLKPCDTYSFNQLIKEHRIAREKFYVLGLGCPGMLDIEKIKAQGIKGITKVIDSGKDLKILTVYGEKTCDRDAVLLEKCEACKGKTHMVYDEILPLEEEPEDVKKDRFAAVEKLEAMSPEERFAFWNGELSKCIRCNACRNVCPACSCMKCVFDNARSGVASKANTDTFEEKMFHIIRAFHVAGRCTDCGECSRVCPQGIPLHLLNRKFIKDINEFYGEYQAGADTETRPPLVNFTFDDVEPSIVEEKGRG